MTAYINQISSLGPKVWYRFNETAGTPVNYGSLATTSTFTDLLLNEQTDVDGRAVYFNGSTSALKLPNHPAFSLFDDRSFTTEMWFKIAYADTLTGTQNNTPVDGDKYRPLFLFLSQNGAQSLGAEIGTTFTGDRGRLIVANFIGTGNIYTSTETYADDMWHHLVVANNTTSFKVYVDGVLKRNATVSASPTSIDMDDNNFYVNSGKLIGARSYDQGGDFPQPLSKFKGRIDEFAIYDRELTSGEVTANFVAGSSVSFAADLVGTASSLMLQPTVSASFNPAAQAPMTASAASGDHYNSTVYFPTTLNTYMSGLTLETWYKFNTPQQLTNYGSLATKVSIFGADAFTDPATGIQGSGVLRTTGGTLGEVANLSDNNAALIADKDFSYGFWVKKTTAEQAAIAVFYDSPSSPEYVSTYWNSTGGITTNARFNNGDHIITSATDITDNNWHYVAVRQSGNTLQMWIDGTSIGTQTVTHSYSAIDQLSLGDGSTTVTEKMYISQFYIGTAANITSTEIAGIYAAGTTGEMQASAFMPEAKVKFNSAFNDYVVSKSPILDVRLDEGTGAPLDYGSAGLILVSQQSPQGYTQGNISLNTKAFRFTDRLQAVRGNYSLSSGTLSNANLCTIGVLFKSANATNVQAFAGLGGRGGTAGTGFSLQQLASSGYLRIIAGNSNGTTNTFTGTTNVADNKWHLAVIVKEASTIKLYIDGKQDISASSSNTLTDAGEFAIAAISGIDATTASRDTLIDEIFVTAGTFTQQEAFEAWQALRLEMDTTATAAFGSDPSLTLGTGATISAAPATASVLVVMPTETQEIAPIITPMYVTALFAHPNYGANAVIDVNYGVTSATADAYFHLPGFSVGEINSVVHMEASALMVNPTTIAGGRISVNPGIADARMVQPGLATTLGALIKPQSLNANAFMVIPPAYYLPSDDRWYQVMLDVNTGITDTVPGIKFFNSPATIYSGGEWNNFQALASLNTSTNPLPAAYTGYFDPQSRAALNIRNISLQLGNGTAIVDNWTMETYIQTTKTNQYLFVGKYVPTSKSTSSAIALKNGKITFIASDTTNVETGYETFSGFKNIADGQWHHIIIQFVAKENRTQVWIDGKLDVQRYGYTPYIPTYLVGYNSANVNLYSDFNISGYSYGQGSIINERDTSLHYFAAIGHEPYLATPATAEVALTTGTRGKGNRARALMLYFWPTFNSESGYYVGQYNNPFAPVGINDTEGKDVGSESYDYDTFYGLSTYLNDTPQQFFDWDVFPLPVQKFYAGDKYRGDRNPLLKDTVKIGSGPQGDTYKDEVTDNYRYLDLIKDVYELDQYDAIFFRNYPDQSNEQDKQGLNSKTEVDEYFNLQEKTLFNDFLESLRKAVDEYGISLFITNPQLAVDLGIIEAATPVPLLRDAGKFLPNEYSDNRAPVVTGRVDSTGNTLDPVNQYGAGWYDTFFNDRHRVINTLEYLTDDNTFIWTDYAFYKHADELNYGAPDKLYKRYENRPYGLQVGDEFIFADSGNPTSRAPFQAIRPEHLKAGVPITALGTTIHEQNFDSYAQGPNPYKDYITTVALPVGTNLKGKLTGGKIFVSFSENVANSFTLENRTQFNTSYVEYHQYDLASNYWVDIAYNAKIIDANTQALYKNNAISDAERGQPKLYDDNNIIKQYWSLSGDNIISQLVPITMNLKGFVGGDVGAEVPVENKKRTRTGLPATVPSTGVRLRDALGRFASGGGSSALTGGNLKTFSVLTGRTYDTGTVFIPSINTRGLWWLSDKNIIEGKVVGGVGMSASATIPNPVVTADHPADVTVNHMLAQATLVDNTSGTKNNLALPLTATAFMPTLGGRTIVAQPAEASGVMVFIYPLTETDYTVTLYLNHTDPILYIRKEVIK